MNYDQPTGTDKEQGDFYDTPPKRKHISVVAIIKSVGRFIKKHRTFFILLIIAVVINFIVYLAIPVIDAGKTKFVNLNTDVRIELNQKVKLKFSDVSAIVINFANDTCPSGAQCYGSGSKSVEYSLSVSDVIYATGSLNQAAGSDYQIKTISSDYETYSIIQITKTDSVK